MQRFPAYRLADFDDADVVELSRAMALLSVHDDLQRAHNG